jgi:hypothetical protein
MVAEVSPRERVSCWVEDAGVNGKLVGWLKLVVVSLEGK